MSVELAGLKICQSKLSKHTQRCDCPEAPPEANSGKRAVVVTRPLRNERRRAPLEYEEARIDGGSWVEAAPRQAASQAGRVPGSPENVVQRARPGERAFHRNSPFDDDVRSDERNTWVVEQMPQDGGGAVEGEIRKDPERLARKVHRCGVCLDHVDVPPATAKPVGQACVELNREHAAGCVGKLRRQPAAACAEIDHELVGPDRGVADEFRRESLRAEEMLATRADPSTRTSCASLGHGPSPSSWLTR